MELGLYQNELMTSLGTWRPKYSQQAQKRAEA